MDRADIDVGGVSELRHSEQKRDSDGGVFRIKNLRIENRHLENRHGLAPH
jgi:hypothetical protein